MPDAKEKGWRVGTGLKEFPISSVSTRRWEHSSIGAAEGPVGPTLRNDRYRSGCCYCLPATTEAPHKKMARMAPITIVIGKGLGSDCPPWSERMPSGEMG